MFTTQCLIQFNTHAAHIQIQTDGVIQVFKHNNHTCDFEVFQSQHNAEASDYIISALPTTYYQVTVVEDLGTV
jgi:hypothetical protein